MTAKVAANRPAPDGGQAMAVLINGSNRIVIAFRGPPGVAGEPLRHLSGMHDIDSTSYLRAVAGKARASMVSSATTPGRGEPYMRPSRSSQTSSSA